MGLPPGGRAHDHPSSLGDGESERQFVFADREERLPWLESEDDDEANTRGGGWRLAMVAASLLFVVVLAAGGWLIYARSHSSAALVADGSTIKAPSTPYRTRPDDPGGRQVAGTGDTSFEVAEGNEVRGEIAAGEAPKPSIDLDQAPAASDTPAASGAIGVQVGAYLTRADAEAGWSTLVSRLEPLQGRGHRVVEGMADSGKVFRLQAIAGSLDDANALCTAVKGAGGDCQVKR